MSRVKEKMQLLIVLTLSLSISMVAMQNITYVAPTVSEGSSCAGHVGNCYTINEIIAKQLVKSNQVLLFLPGEHIVSGNQSTFLFINGVRRLAFAGLNASRPVISCKKRFYFRFNDAQYINFSNLTFANCSGHSGGYFNASHTFYFSRSAEINFDAVSISCNAIKSVGIALTEIISRFVVNNSYFSTKREGIGLATYTMRNYVELTVLNTVFNGSCIAVEGTQKVSFTLVSSTIERCLCPKVMQFLYLTIDVALENITARENKGQHLMYVHECKYVQFSGFCHFYRNSGGVLISSSSRLIVETAQIEFINNTVSRGNGMPGVPMFIRDSTLFVRSSSVVFSNNRGQHTGGILAQRSPLWFVAVKVSFYSCNGENGGALALYQNSSLYFMSDLSNFVFANNKAQRGGAIYIDDNGYMNLDRELMKSPIIGTHAHFMLSNNTAQLGGDQLYGGWIDWFYKVADRKVYYNRGPISAILTFDPEGKDDVSSDPVRVCICIGGIPNCNLTHYYHEIFPGQTLTLEVVAVGQRFGTVVAAVIPTFVRLESSSNYIMGKITEIQNIQVVQRSCSTLQYTVMSSNTNEILQIIPFEERAPKFDSMLLRDHPEYELLFQTFSINFKMKRCPIGFIFNKDNNTCICLSLLSTHGLGCEFLTYRILRRAQDWIGKTNIHTLPDEYPGVIIHQYCPNGYCRSDNESLSIQLEFQDQQCSFQRSGILCGECKENYSQILGSSKCKKCSNINILVIIPSVLVAGILLVTFLMTLNLTVSSGMINGLIFYSNIIRAQHSTYFTPDISNSFLSKFIFWLNLDLGIETCFFVSLDAYTKVWLQFFFPIYIWILVAIIIVTSHYSTIASKLSGRNAVQVLATLFLLSYTKMLQIVVTVFSFTTITYPDGYSKAVWLYDGNVDFLIGKHLGLFIATVFMLILLSVPYTLSLVNIQWLLKISHYRVMFWVQKLLPIFDAYTGPYKINHRYWTGLLLILRIIALVTFSLNRSNNPSINLLATAVISNALLAYLAITRWIYKSLINNCLELIFLLNLSIASIAILFDISNGKRSPAAIFTSTSVALVLFVAIVAYHITQKLLSIRFVSDLKQKIKEKFTHKKDDHVNEVNLPEEPKVVTTSVIQLTNELATPLLND